MSNKRKGQTVSDGQWRRHLRPAGKATFWGKQRLADRKLCEDEPIILPLPKPKKKKAKKRYGIQWGRRWRQWYATEKARDEAYNSRQGWMTKLFGEATKVER